MPFSTLGWENPEFVPEGYGTGAAKGLTTADLPDHATWEQWFPADWVSEMREQIRLWFYSQLFMSVALTGRAPFRKVLGYEKMLDEHGKEMHGSWGNMIDADRRIRPHGRRRDALAVLLAASRPQSPLRLRSSAGDQAAASDALELGEVPRRLRRDRVVPAGLRRPRREAGRTAELQPLDHWLVERTAQLVAEAEAGYERWLTVDVTRAFEAYVDDLSNWYIRRSRRRFWDGEEAALRTLWFGLVQGLRVIAPVMPFLAEHLWQALVTDVIDDAPESVFLSGWPAERAPDTAQLAEVSELRRVVALGHQARSASGLKLRQPLRRLVVEGAPLAAAHVDEIAEELRVKEVEFGHVDAELRVKPHLPALGPKLGKELGVVRAALQAGDFEELGGGRFLVAGHELAPDEVLVERAGKDGWAVAGDAGVTVAIDTAVDDELALEGRVYELIHRVNSMRKDAGLELTDRIGLTIPTAEGDLLEHADWIARETLALSVVVGQTDAPAIQKV